MKLRLFLARLLVGKHRVVDEPLYIGGVYNGASIYVSKDRTFWAKWTIEPRVGTDCS